MENQLKIFNLEKEEEVKKNSSSKRKINKWIIYVDGAARNNPGPAGAGIYIQKNDLDFKKVGYYLGIKTNNQAEYLALAISLFLVKKEDQNPDISIISDSQLLIRQLKGLYKIKNPILKKIKLLIDDLLQNTSYKFKHVLRANNKIADKLANLGIDEKKKMPLSFIQILKTYNIEDKKDKE